MVRCHDVVGCRLDISACSIHGAFFFGGQARGKVIDNEVLLKVWHELQNT